jgi:hypothetical protein
MRQTAAAHWEHCEPRRSLGFDEPEVNEALEAAIAMIDRGLEKRFVSAREAGELATDTDARA